MYIIYIYIILHFRLVNVHHTTLSVIRSVILCHSHTIYIYHYLSILSKLSYCIGIGFYLRRTSTPPPDLLTRRPFDLEIPAAAVLLGTACLRTQWALDGWVKKMIKDAEGLSRNGM